MDVQQCLSVAKDFYALCTQVRNLGMKGLLEPLFECRHPSREGTDVHADNRQDIFQHISRPVPTVFQVDVKAYDDRKHK